jgi:hypothetical protein
MANDAVATEPTVEEQVNAFKSFSTVEGDVKDDGKPTGAAKAVEGKPAKPMADSELATDKTAAEETAETEVDNRTDEERAAEGDDDVEDQPQQPKQTAAAKQRSAQERINKAVRAQRSAERRADEAMRRLDALEARLNGTATAATTTSAATSATEGAPDPSTFEFGELDAKYIRALARYEAKQEVAAERAAQAKTQQTAEQARAQREFQTKADALAETGSAKYEDFNEVVMEAAKAGEWPMSETIGSLVLDSDVGADIAYHLATHPDEARKLFGKSPARQAADFGRLEAQFSSATDADDSDEGESEDKPVKVVKTSKAPAPPEKKARGTGTRTGSPDTQSFAEFEAAVMGGQR